MNLCVIIPCFNHASKLYDVLLRIKQSTTIDLPIIVVDDGSSLEEQKIIDDTISQLKATDSYFTIYTERLETNRGKGVAVERGLRVAKALGFSHAFQIDADGQHEIEALPQFISFAQNNEQYLVSGKPIYDHSIPKSRLYGRSITHFWVCVETLSFQIQDSMCGFRIYPIEKTLKIYDDFKIGSRMDFDIEIIVRLFWRKTPVYFIPIKVTYPQDGVSNFRGFQDNLHISWLHTRLVFTKFKLLLQQAGSWLCKSYRFIVKNKHEECDSLRKSLDEVTNSTNLSKECSIKLIQNEDQKISFQEIIDNTEQVSLDTSFKSKHNVSKDLIVTANQDHEHHWAKQKELKGLRGMRFMFSCYQLFGITPFVLMLYPVILYYFVIAHDAKKHSAVFLAKAKQSFKALPLEEQQQYLVQTKDWSRYWHFFNFGYSILDKVRAWQGALKLEEDIIFCGQSADILNTDQANTFNVDVSKVDENNIVRGKIIICSHLGNIEVCRAIVAHSKIRKINALVYLENAQRFKQIMEEFAPDANVEVISLKDVGPELAISLDEKLNKGEWIAIMGDRVAVPLSLDKGTINRGTISANACSDLRITYVDFLGSPAPFAQGPFILASMLKAPIILLFGLKDQASGRILVYAENFATQIVLNRQHRQADLQKYIQQYALRLEFYAIRYPLDWFNFFDFWHKY